MKRLNDAWFFFKDKYSLDFGIKLLETPKRGVPCLKGTYKAVSGRDGSVFISDGSYENVEVSVSFDALYRSRVPEVDAWLTGSGLLRFSDEPEAAYEATISKAFSRRSVTRHLDGQRYAVVFTCQPFKLAWPASAAKVYTQSGARLPNPGTAPAKPRVKITGHGSFSVSIGAQTLYFTDVTDGIIVDSELMDALTLDEKQLANDHVSGQLFEIQPGKNIVSWEVDDGEVASVEILPRWRWI